MPACHRNSMLTAAARQNPAVTSKPVEVFTYIAQALEAEVIQGQTAARSVAAAKHLIASTGVSVQQVLGSLPPEMQQTVRAYFA